MVSPCGVLESVWGVRVQRRCLVRDGDGCKIQEVVRRITDGFVRRKDGARERSLRLPFKMSDNERIASSERVDL